MEKTLEINCVYIIGFWKLYFIELAEEPGSSEQSIEKNSEELNDLLQSALTDFSSYSSSSETTSENTAEQAEATSSKNTSKETQSDEKLQENFEDKFKNLFLNDVDDSTFSSQMSNLLSEVQSEIRTFVDDSSLTGSDDNTDTVAQAVNSLMQNIEQVKDNMKNESSDGSFNSGIPGMEQMFNMNVPFMEQMFEMLISKEILYPSLLSVKEKYPSWLEENKNRISNDELNRYTQQYNIIRRICIIFESESNSDTEELKQKRIMELIGLLQEMTDLGQPPQDFGESLPTGLGNEIQGANMDPNGCNTM